MNGRRLAVNADLVVPLRRLLDEIANLVVQLAKQLDEIADLVVPLRRLLAVNANLVVPLRRRLVATAGRSLSPRLPACRGAEAAVSRCLGPTPPQRQRRAQEHSMRRPRTA